MDLLQGTLDLLILQVLVAEPRHGYGIARLIEQRTGAELTVEEGSLYPALYRLERRGLLAAEWGTSELGRRAKFYALTGQGRRRLKQHVTEWKRYSHAVERLLAAGRGR